MKFLMVVIGELSPRERSACLKKGLVPGVTIDLAQKWYHRKKYIPRKQILNAQVPEVEFVICDRLPE